tara:strand:+ start:1116 stop:1511 length:396 start_codon:yes stop_codon:yes gene_type:complete
MSANNRRIRRIIVDLLFKYGEMTKEGMADLLAKHKSVRTVPSPHSLSALMSKNPQIVAVGSEQVENAVGTKANHLIYDVDRKLITCKEDIIYSRSLTVMTPQQKSLAVKCKCGRIRVLPPKSKVCLHCIRK